MRTLWHNARIAGQSGANAVVTNGSVIEWVGDVSLAPECERTIDLEQAWVTPGLVDCHTHLVFGGQRAHEFDLRLQGKSYAEIAKAGGGIASTVRSTRQTDPQMLYRQAKKRLQQLIDDGVSTVEIKSGYGLDEPSERKMLEVIHQLGQSMPVNVRSTALLAHALPPEYSDDPQGYIDWVCQMLPKFHQEQLFDAVDAFCEHLAFTPEQVQQVFECAKSLGIPVKLHAEQLSLFGGTELAARYQALSADHLEYLDESGVAAMARSGTVAVLLPGAFYMLREKQLPPIELLRRYNVPMAIASDCNPGTAPVLSLRLMMNMACTLFGLTPQEALDGVTIHAAKALGLGDTHGQIAPGYTADMMAWQVDDLAELSYWLGGRIAHQRIYHGELDATRSL